MSTPLRALVFSLAPSWLAVARLPRALQRAGFAVGLACDERGHLAATRFRDRTFFLPRRLRGARLVRQLAEIARDWRPDLLLPGDDDAVAFLGGVHARLLSATDADTVALRELLNRSLGHPAALAEAASKRRVLGRARSLGLRVPECCEVRGRAEALARARLRGFPVVLKRSSGFAGDGVEICRDEAEFAAAWRRLHRAGGLRGRLRAWRRTLRGRQLPSWWLPKDTGLTVNRFIRGEMAMCQVAAAEGRVLTAAAARKVQCHPAVKGPSSVVRFIDGGEMVATATALVGAWGLTGLIAFDFIVDEGGRAWLLECNPRVTALAHLSGLAGEDLCEALHCHFAGRATPAPRARQELEVAHFPQEWLRDPASPHLGSALHDIPWDDPPLLRSLLRLCQ